MTVKDGKKKVGKNLSKFFLRLIVTVSIFAFLAQKINWPEFKLQFLKANFILLMYACLLFGIVYVNAALRWWFLLKVQNIFLPLRVVTALTFIGQFFNSFLLGAVGGDLIKAVYLQKYAPNQKTHATLSILMDRVLGLLILVFASLLIIPWQFNHLMLNNRIQSVLIGLFSVFSLCLVIGVVLYLFPFHRISPELQKIWHKIPYRHIIELVISGFRQHGSALSMTFASILVGIIMTMVMVAAGYLIGIAIGLKVTYMQMLVIMTVVICVISLPISIGGHGVREGIFVIMFSAFGVINVGQNLGGGQEAAILFSLLFFAIPAIWSLVGGLVYLVYRHDYAIHKI